MDYEKLYFFPYSRKLKIFDNLKINKINQTFVRKSIEKCFKKIDFKEPILISYYPFIYPVINKISFKKIIFHVIDNWMAFDVPKTMNILIQNMTSRAHITITSSAMMYENLKEFSNNIFLLDHGTDLDLFKPVINYEAKEHSLIKNLKKPVIGYYGALHKIDFELVNNISKIHTDKSFIFIGPVKGDQGLKGKLQVSKNIYIYDSIARSELPNILVGLDLFWMPFKKDEITKYMLPIKLFEVLSAGLPVISTDLPECRRVSKNLVKYGETLADFSNLIHSEVDDKDIDMRYHRAKEMGEYDWNQRYLTFKNFITTKNE